MVCVCYAVILTANRVCRTTRATALSIPEQAVFSSAKMVRNGASLAKRPGHNCSFPTVFCLSSSFAMGQRESSARKARSHGSTPAGPCTRHGQREQAGSICWATRASLQERGRFNSHKNFVSRFSSARMGRCLESREYGT